MTMARLTSQQKLMLKDYLEAFFHRKNARITQHSRLEGVKIAWFNRSSRNVDKGIILGGWKHSGGWGYFVLRDRDYRVVQCDRGFQREY
jgi:hypothetical protein